MEELGEYKREPMEIEVDTEKAIFTPTHRVSAAEWEFAGKRCAELGALGMIRPSRQSKYTLATVVVRKKDEAREYTKHRQCGDYCPINSHTPPDRYPLPRIENIFRDVQGATIFGKLDLRQGYHQIPLTEKDKAKTSFWGPNRQLYEWNVVPYSLKNAPPFFQRIMDHTLRGMAFARYYIDDIALCSRNFEEHMGHLREVLAQMDTKGLRVHSEKCVFGADSIEFLGYRLTGEGILPQLEKTRAMREMPTPKNLPTLRAVLGFFSYYKKFVSHFNSIAAPLNALLK